MGNIQKISTHGGDISLIKGDINKTRHILLTATIKKGMNAFPRIKGHSSISIIQLELFFPWRIRFLINQWKSGERCVHKSNFLNMFRAYSTKWSYLTNPNEKGLLIYFKVIFKDYTK